MRLHERLVWFYYIKAVRNILWEIVVPRLRLDEIT